LVSVPLPHHAWRGSHDATAYLTGAYWPTVHVTTGDQPIAHCIAIQLAIHLANYLAANVRTADWKLQLLDLEPEWLVRALPWLCRCDGQHIRSVR